MFLANRLEEKYLWTHHARQKLRHYRLTEARIKRIIRHPMRMEEAVVEGAIACMQPADGGTYSEIWTLYVLAGAEKNRKKIKIISAWRYPGKSPERDPIPADILREIRAAIV